MARRFALTIAAVLCIIVDHYIALDAFGTPGALVTALLRGFLVPFHFLQHQLFRLSVHWWEPAAPLWYGGLTAVLSLTPYVLLDLVLGGTRADRAAASRSP